MCLSTAYKNKISPENLIMKNVMSIETLSGNIVLTDLMERKLNIKGELSLANLTDGLIVIKTNE